MPSLRSRYRFAALVRPEVGLIGRVAYPPAELGAPSFDVVTAALGNLTMAFEHIRTGEGTDARDEMLGGAGGDIDLETAWVKAVAEAAERYAAMVYAADDFTVSSPADLGSLALDLRRIPRCSESEYSDPKCPLLPAQLSAPIRWVRGHSLVSGRDVFVPAVMTHLYFRPWPSERFWFPISTGVAAHTDVASALVSAICESVERDAIALTWLAELPLSRIEGCVSPGGLVSETVERLRLSNVRQHWFDATTDLGIPTILSVQVAPNHPTCEMFVSCATSLNAEEAYAKTIREASTARVAMSRPRAVPNNVIDFTKLTHGADYYGRGGHSADFDFLLKSRAVTSLDEMQGRMSGDPLAASREQLRFLVSKIKGMGMEAVAIDLTTDELRDVGLWVVRVVIPDLMPISFVHRARYLGTPRLFDYAARAGRPIASQADVNSHPMPFA